MIEGFVTEDGVPAYEAEIGGERWQAIIDTGFNGELELPERLRPQVNAQFVGRVVSLLAANQLIEEDVFLVNYLYFATDQEFEVPGIKANFKVRGLALPAAVLKKLYYENALNWYPGT